MMRSRLVDLVREAAAACGYAFYEGQQYRMASECKEFPAVWLLPPKLVKTEGRLEGVKYYDVEIKIAGLCRQYSRQEKEAMWAEMEEVAAKMCLIICSDSAVRTITDVRYVTGELDLSASGEMSMTVNFRVQMPFFYETRENSAGAELPG